MRPGLTLMMLSLFGNLLLAEKVDAQTVYYSPGPGFNADNTEFELIGQWENRRVVYTKRFSKGVLRLYSDRMMLLDTVVLGWLPYGVERLDFIALRSRFMALYQYRQKRETIFAGALLDSRGRLVQPPIVLARCPAIQRDEDGYAFVASADKNRLLVYRMAEAARATLTRAELVLLDSNLQRIENDTLTIPFKRSEGPPLVLRLSNAGGWYLLYGSSPFPFARRLEALTLLYKPAGRATFLSRKFLFPSRPVAGPPLLTLAEKDQSGLWLTAFRFGEKNRHVAALVCWRLDLLSLGTTNHWEQPLSPALRKAFADRRSRRKAVFDDYVPRALMLRRSGPALLVAGQSFTDAEGRPHFGSVALFPLDSSGFSAAPLKIARPLARSGGPLPGPFLMVNRGSALHFLLNQPHQVSRLLTTSIYLLRDYRYRSNTGVAVLPVMEKQGQGYLWLTQMGEQISDRDVLVPCLKGRRLYFGSIRY